MSKYMIAILLTMVVLGVMGPLYVATRSQSVNVEAPTQQVEREMPRGDTGTIEGYVCNSEGQPVAETFINLDKVGVLMVGLHRAVSDEQGKFVIENLEPGTYTLYGDGSLGGYPITSTSFYNPSMVHPQVNVYGGQVTSGVVLNLGTKLPKVEGRVTDAVTHKAIKDPHLTLRRADKPSSFISTSGYGDGTFEVLAPSVPFTIEVSAPGYKKWFYKETGSENQADALRLTSAESKNLTIALTPDK